MKFVILRVEGEVTLRSAENAAKPLHAGDAVAEGAVLSFQPGSRILVKDEEGRTRWLSGFGEDESGARPGAQEDGAAADSSGEEGVSRGAQQESHGFYQVPRQHEVLKPLDFSLTRSITLTREEGDHILERGSYDPRIEEGSRPLHFRMDGQNPPSDQLRGGGGENEREPFPVFAPLNEQGSAPRVFPTVSVPHGGIAGGREQVVEGEALSGAQFTVDAADGLDRIRIGTTEVTLAQLNGLSGAPVSIATPRGVLTLTGYDAATGVVTYDYTPTAQDHSGGDVVESIAVTAIDRDGDAASAQLEILIADTVPVAQDDAVGGLQEDAVVSQSIALLGNDQLNVDGPVTVTGVAAGVVGSAGGQVGVAVAGVYGTLTVDAGGHATYQLNNGSGAVQGLSAGQVVTDTFTYTITDADGDASTAQVTVSITGANDGPVITGTTQVPYEEDSPPLSVLAADFDISDTDAGATISDAVVTFTNFLAAEDQINVGALPAGISYSVDSSVPGQYRIHFTGAASIADYESALRSITYANSSQTPTEGARNYTLQITDDSGGSANFTGSVSVDATPDPVNNSVQIVEGHAAIDQSFDDGDAATTEGNLLGNDDPGTPGGSITAFTYVDEAGTSHTVASGTSVDTQYGAIIVNADGTWSYTPDPTEDQTNPVLDSIVYTVTDGNGDSATAVFTIDVKDRPMSVSPQNATVDEAGLQALTGGAAPVTDTRSLNLITNDPLQDVRFTGISDGDDSGLTSDGQTIYYYLDAAAHLLTASTATSEGAVTASNTVFTVQLTDTSGGGANPGYQVTLHQPVDHPAGNGANSVTLNYSFTATDIDSSISGGFGVTILDDLPEAGGISLVTPEDSSIDFHLMEGDGTVGIDGQPLAVGGTANILESGAVIGTLRNLGGGNFRFSPNPDYSGSPSFGYTITDSDGDSATGTVGITVTPVSDAPSVPSIAPLQTDEDTPVALGLPLPSVTDATDQTPSGGQDAPERLGAISLSGFAPGSQLLKSDGTVLFTATAAKSDVTVRLSDSSDHVTGVTSDIAVTKAEFQGLQVRPAPDSHENMVIDYTVTEYEVDSTGSPLAGTPGASTTRQIEVDVRAVTDAVDLKIDGGDHPSTSPYAATIAEDTSLDLGSLLSAAFQDLDGSEHRSFVISNPAGNGAIAVNGTTINGGDSITIPAPALSTSTNGMPSIAVGAPPQVSGDFNGIEIRLVALDSDADSPGASPVQVGDSVFLDLEVTPVAGDVQGTDATTPEDTPLTLASLIQLQDTDGSETVTAVSIKNLPTGWKVLDAGGNTVFTGNGATDYTVPGADLNYQLLPPAHSSADISAQFEVTSQDTSNGTTVSSTVQLSPNVVVVPRAEVTTPPAGGDTDSDGDGTPDLTMNGDHTYTTHAQEDSWFALDDTGTFDLKGPWSNQDPDEQTFAQLTPQGSLVNGSQFRYTDSASVVHTLTFVGTPVEIPMAYLDTVEFKAAENVAGTFQILVEAKTVDTDPDTGAQNTAVSGKAYLTNLVVEPVADPVTLSVVSPVVADEDTAQGLTIRPTSADRDGSETFNVTIQGIPAGAILVYDGAQLSPSGGAVTINDFDSTKSLTIQPPPQSNADFTLAVSAVSVDGSDTSAVSQTLNIDVQVRGVADAPTVSTATPSYDEGSLDSGAAHILLSDFITNVANVDSTDGSQTQQLLITGLDQGFELVGTGGYTPNLLSGSGANRLWSLDVAQLSNVEIVAPANFSGTVSFDAKVVVTEDDGDSLKYDMGTLTAGVTASPEATMTTATTADEDVLTLLDFSLVPQNGDNDETLSSVWIKESDLTGADFTLYLGNGAATPLLGASGQPGVDISGGWVKLTGGAIGNVYALGAPDKGGNYSFTVRYEVTDAPQDGTSGLDQTQQSGDVNYQLTVNPVTDPIAAQLGSLSAHDIGNPGQNTHATISGSTVQVDGNTVVKVPLTFSQVDDPAEGSNGADVDGSEQLVRLEFNHVPEGVTVTGASYVGDAPDGSYSGRWVMNLSGRSFTSDLLEEMEFVVDGTSAQLAGVAANIEIVGVSQDQGTGSEQSASRSWTLQVGQNFDDSNASTDAPATIDTAQQHSSSPSSEDQPVQLDNLVDFAISGNGSFSVRVEGLPTGSQVSGMMEIAPGVWSVSGSGDNSQLQSLLSSVQITPPENFNDNNGGPLAFDVTLTTYASSGQRNVQSVAVSNSITPVSDPIETNMNTPNGSEDQAVNLSITLSDAADGSAANLIGNKVYLQLDESNVTGAGGTLMYNGSPLVLQTITGDPNIPNGDYYVLNNAMLGTALNLVYQPGANASGSVVLKSWVVEQETGAANFQTTQASSQFSIAPVLDGVTPTVNGGSGDEDTVIPIQPTTTSLIDNDGSESIISAILSGIPDGFLVKAGNDASSATLATNLGDDGTGAGTNDWALDLSSGTLPSFIGVVPPPDWSGDLVNLRFSVQVQEAGGAPSSFSDTFDLHVAPIADGITMNPTLSFGTEGEIVPLNLNSSMQDADGSETATVMLKGMGAHAAFFGDGNALLTSSYDAGTDTYTLSGLSRADLASLGTIQKSLNATVDVSVQTVDGPSVSTQATGSFDLQIDPALATTGDDTLLYSGDPLDGLAGVDTVILRLGEDLDFSDPATASHLDNIEKLDLGVGDHQLSSLSLQDVLDITDANHTLEILGESGDAVTLANGAGTWSNTGTITESGHTFDVYTHSLDSSVQVKIETAISDSVI